MAFATPEQVHRYPRRFTLIFQVLCAALAFVATVRVGRAILQYLWDSQGVPIDQRGPHWSATQPAIGAPSGVPPSAMPMRMAMTRPRKGGGVVNCINALLELRKVSMATPTSASAAPNSQ